MIELAATRAVFAVVAVVIWRLWRVGTPCAHHWHNFTADDEPGCIRPVDGFICCKCRRIAGVR